MTVAAARDLAPTASPAHDRRLSRAGRLFRQASSSPLPRREAHRAQHRRTASREGRKGVAFVKKLTFP